MRLAGLMAAAAFSLAACAPGGEAPAPAAEPAAEQVETPFGPGPDQTDGEPLDATFSGTATWSGADVPATARLIIEVRDLTRTADVDDLVLREEFPVTAGSPAAFSGTVSKFDLIPGGDLVLRARIQDGFAILLASDGDIDLADGGETAGLDVALFDPEEMAKGLPRRMITPEGWKYTCGGEAVTIALEAGAAYVTFGDGTSVKLPKMDGAAEGVTQFSTGRFLVEQRMDPAGTYTLRFGRGRATPMACESAQ